MSLFGERDNRSLSIKRVDSYCRRRWTDLRFKDSIAVAIISEIRDAVRCEA